jgi:hypothetical protein
MTAGIEQVAIQEFLFETLRDNSAVAAIVAARIYADRAPSDTTFPFVIIMEQAASPDVMGIGARRIMAGGLWQVKGIVQDASFGGTLASLAAAIDAALHRKAGTVDNGVVLACTRESTFRLAETGPGGEQYRHLGGLYRVLAQ